jgi:hypothetical protein
MIRDYSPILVGKVAPAPTHIPAPRPQPLEPAPVQPCYEGADDTAEWMINGGGREILEGMLNVECPEAAA